MGKISGPLLDRIDIHIEVPSVPFKDLSASQSGTTSGEMRRLVMQTRAIQAKRFEGTKTRNNANMSSRMIRTHCKLDDAGANLLHSTMNELGLSARAHDKILRVARTIADMEGSPRIEVTHLNEAVNYRMLDRNMRK